MLKTLLQLVPSNVTNISFTDDDINDNSILEIYTTDMSVYPIAVSQEDTTVNITLNNHSSSLGVKLFINNVDDFNIQDNLNSTSPTDGLSAKQGKSLGTRTTELEEWCTDLEDSVNISYDNSTTGISADNVQNAIDEVFQYVSNGKSLVASAITDKGVPTLATDTFETMATNIGDIETGGGATGYLFPKYKGFEKSKFKICKGLGCPSSAVVTINDKITISNNSGSYSFNTLLGFYVEVDVTNIDYFYIATTRTNTNGRLYTFALTVDPNTIASTSTIPSDGTSSYGRTKYTTDASGNYTHIIDVRSYTGTMYIGLSNNASSNSTYINAFYALGG